MIVGIGTYVQTDRVKLLSLTQTHAANVIYCNDYIIKKTFLFLIETACRKRYETMIEYDTRQKIPQ